MQKHRHRRRHEFLTSMEKCRDKCSLYLPMQMKNIKLNEIPVAEMSLETVVCHHFVRNFVSNLPNCVLVRSFLVPLTL